jgi:hypothetical protein
VVSIHRPSFNIELLIFYFSNLKRTYSLSRENQFQRLKPKYVAYQNTWGSRYKEAIAERPFIFVADKFPALPAENRFFNL